MTALAVGEATVKPSIWSLAPKLDAVNCTLLEHKLPSDLTELSGRCTARAVCGHRDACSCIGTVNPATTALKRHIHTGNGPCGYPTNQCIYTNLGIASEGASSFCPALKLASDRLAGVTEKSTRPSTTAELTAAALDTAEAAPLAVIEEGEIAASAMPVAPVSAEPGLIEAIGAPSNEKFTSLPGTTAPFASQRGT